MTYSQRAGLMLVLWTALAAEPRTDYYGDPLPKGAVARMGMAPFPSVVGDSDLAFSADGKSLVTVDADGQVRVWDAATGELLRRRQLERKPQGEDEALEQIALAPGGGRVAAWDSRRVHVFDTATGRELGRRDAVATDSFIPLLPTFSPDGKRLFVQRQTDRLRPADKYVWEIGAGGGRPRLTELSGFEHPYERVEAVAFSPDGRRLFGIAGGLRCWDAETGREVGQRDEAYRKADGLLFAPDGKTLAVFLSSPGRVDLLDTATRKKIATLKPPGDGKGWLVRNPAFSPDGRLLTAQYFLGEREGGLLVWDVRERKLQRRLSLDGKRNRVVLSPDGKTLARQSGVHEIVLLDAATGRRRNLPPNHQGYVPAVAVSADGRRIASGDSKGELRLWDAATGRPLRAWKAAEALIRYCWIAPDGKRLVSLDQNGSLAAWDTAAGKPQWRGTVQAGESFVAAAGFAADGKRLHLAIQSEEGPPRILLSAWDAGNGKRLSRHTRAAVAPMGQVVFASGAERLFARHGIEEVVTQRRLAALPNDVGSPADFSPDGRYLIATRWQDSKRCPGQFTHKGLTLFETATGEEVCRWETDPLHYVAFTPDGRAVVTADEEGLSVWGAATGRRWHRMSWPPPEESSEQLAPISWAVLPGGRLVTGGASGILFVWDLAPSTWPAAKAAGKLDRPKLEGLWSDLAGDARTAHRAVAELSAAPSAAVPFLGERLRPLTVDAARFERLITDLDSEKYAVREAASRELDRQRYYAEAALRRALERTPALETRRRVEAILDAPRRPPAEALRTLRAIAVLERAGTPEARRVLESLAGGDDAPETRDARAALRRLDRP